MHEVTENQCARYTVVREDGRAIAYAGVWFILCLLYTSFVPSELVEKYSAAMDAVFGEGATTVLSIRPEGVVCMD